jgi:hypothetical protein
LLIEEPTTYSSMVAQPVAAEAAALAGDAAYYAGADPFDYRYAQQVEAGPSSGDAAEPAAAAAEAAYYADYSFGEPQAVGPAAVGSMATNPTVMSPRYASTAELPAAAPLAAAWQDMTMHGTHRQLQQYELQQQQQQLQQQQRDVPVGVMSSQDLQALAAQQQHTVSQQQQQQQQQAPQEQLALQQQLILPSALGLKQQPLQQPGSQTMALPPLPSLFGMANNDSLSKFPLYYGDAGVGRLVTGRPFDVVPKFAGAHPPTVRRMAAGLPVQVRQCFFK